MIELLTVIAIIAVLMSMLMPVLGAAKDGARRAQAKNDCVSLVNAVSAYHTDYGVYPLNSTQASAGAENPGWDTCYGDPGGLYSSADLCNILRAIPDNKWNQNNKLNTRQSVYFDGKNAASATNPRGGFVTAASGVTGPTGKPIPYGAFVDPWGMEYVVFLDANYDGNVNMAVAWFYYVNTPDVRAGVAASSMGRDNGWGTAGNGNIVGSDDITTWQ